MRVSATGRARLTKERIGFAFVDVMTFEMIVGIVDAQVQLDDAVAAGLRRIQRIDIDTAFPQFGIMEIERQVVLTDLLRDDLMSGRHDGDGSDIDTVVTVFGTRVVIIRTALGDVIAVLPCVRCLTFADRDLFGKLIRVVYEEVQAVDTVADVRRLEAESIFVGSV